MVDKSLLSISMKVYPNQTLTKEPGMNFQAASQNQVDTLLAGMTPAPKSGLALKAENLRLSRALAARAMEVYAAGDYARGDAISARANAAYNRAFA